MISSLIDFGPIECGCECEQQASARVVALSRGLSSLLRAAPHLAVAFRRPSIVRAALAAVNNFRLSVFGFERVFMPVLEAFPKKAVFPRPRSPGISPFAILASRSLWAWRRRITAFSRVAIPQSHAASPGPVAILCVLRVQLGCDRSGLSGPL